MIGKRYAYTLTDRKVIEQIVEDEHAAINHIVLGNREALPEHRANANVYMIVVRGSVTLRLEDGPANVWPAGSVLTIPHQAKMNVANEGEAVLELFIVKSPPPKDMA